MKFPTPLDQNLLPEAIAVSGGATGMVGIAVTLHANREESRMARVSYRQVDEVTGYPDLPFGFEPCALKHSLNLYLEGRIARLSGSLASINQYAALCIL
jgi:hypothetical protein